MKRLSFRNIIIIGVFLFFALSTVAIFYAVNTFHFENTKNNYIEDNIRLVKVVKEEIESEKQSLEIKAKTISQDVVLFNSLANNVYLQIPGVRKKEVKVKIRKMNRIRYLKISNTLFSKIAGEPGYFMGEIYLEIFNKDLKRVASVGGLAGEYLDKSDDEYIKDAFGNKKFQISGSINTIVDKGGKLFIKAIKDVFVDQAYGLVVISKPLNDFYISEIKRKINKEIMIIKDNKIYLSTIYDGTEMVKGDGVDFLTCDGLCYQELELAGKKYGFSVFPITDYKNNQVALVGIGYNLGDMEAFYKKSTKRFMYMLFLFSVLFLLMLYLFLSRVFKPFSEIIGGIKKIRDGDYNFNIKLKGTGELKVLAESINELGESIETREGELKKLNQEILKKNTQLMRLDELKDEFLANTSHELRTPLNGIIGIAETLIDGVAGRLTDQVEKNLDMIVSSGKRLGALVNDILDFSKLKNDKINFQIQSLELNNLISVVIALSRPMLKGKDLKIVTDMPESLYIKGDENRIQQIMYNLIGNAIKFTKKGEVKVKVIRKKNDVILEVEDTGIGIAKSRLESIFESFEQGDGSTERKYQGTGLGLSISKKLIELMGGSITVKSKLGKGSCFTFKFPVNQKVSVIQNRERVINEYKGDSEVEIKEYDILAKNQRKTILIVDDEPINVTVLNNYFSMKSNDILVAHNGQEALDIVDEKGVEIDLILLDVMMPNMSGYEVAEIVRKKYSWYEVPILTVTAKNRPEDIEKGFVSGANDYLTKPVEKKELYARAETLISIKKAVKSAMDYTKEYEEEKQKREISDEIANFTKSLSSSLLLKDVFKELLENISSRLNMERYFLIMEKSGEHSFELFNDIEKEEAKQIYSENIEVFEKAKESGTFTEFWNKKNFLGVLPINYGERVNAYFILVNEESIEIKDEKMLYTLLNSAGFAIENAKLFEEVEEQRSKLSESIAKLQSVEEMVSLIYTEKDEGKVAGYILELILKERDFGFEKGICLKLKDDNKTFTAISLYMGNKLMDSKGLSDFEDEEILLELIEKKETIFSKNENLNIAGSEWKDIMLSPILYKDQLYGVFIFDLGKGSLETVDRSIVFNIFSKNLAIYFENKKLEEDGNKNLKLNTIINLSQAIVHEIKTPLSGIKGFSKIAQKKLSDLKVEFDKYENKALDTGREKLNEYMDVILNETERVDEMANDILEYSVISRDNVEIEDIDLKALIEDLLETKEKDIKDNDIKLELNFENDTIVQAEKESLVKAISHIIKNSIEAVDFLKEIKSIEISVKKEAENDISIIIRDNGVGISPEIEEKIFEPMVTSKIQGTGLGLTITKAILSSYEADIEIRSEYGKWTEVEMRFKKQII